MPITIQGCVPVQAPREQVWKLLFDPDVLGRVIGRIPGITVEQFERVSENEYHGVAQISVAMIKGRYEGKVVVLEQHPHEYIRLDGRVMGAGNRGGGEAELRLAEQGAHTLLNYRANGNLSGPLAGASQRLVDSIGRQFIDQGARALAEELVSEQRAETRLSPEPAAIAGSLRRISPATVVALAVVVLLLALFIVGRMQHLF